MFEPAGVRVESIDCRRVLASADFLFQSSYFPFQAFDPIDRIIEAGVIQRLQEGPDRRERGAKFPPFRDLIARCVCHRKLLIGEPAPWGPSPRL